MPHRTRRFRRLIALTAVGLAVTMTGCVSAVGGEDSSKPLSKDEIQLVTVVHSSTNAYMLDFAAGAKAVADSVGLPLTVIVSDNDSQKQLSQIQAVVASGKKVVAAVHPLGGADVPAIVKAITGSGGYLTTQENRPADYHTWDVSDKWVAHITHGGVDAGYETAKTLFESMGGKGGVVALDGPPGNPIPTQRHDGLEKALKEYPDVTLLGSEVANWDRKEAFDVTQTLLSKYGSEVTGVWGASDSMAFGALSAAEQNGRKDIVASGIDGTEEAIQAISSGSNFVTTYSADAYYNGALGMWLAYQAATGELDVSSLSKEQREGNYEQFAIDASNAAKFLKPSDADTVVASLKKDPWERLIGPDLQNEES